jgi:hypothetical protein
MSGSEEYVMIRELTKSALSFSWALSLLGIKQAISMGSGQNGGDLLSPVTQMAVGQLDESMKGIYRSGDSLQSRMVDMAFSGMNPANWLNPGNWTNLGNWTNPSNWARTVQNYAAAAGQCGCTTPGAGENSASPGNDPTTAPGNSGAACGWGPPQDSSRQ